MYEIMIVDDIPENLNFLSSLLEENGYSCRPFKSPRLAFKSAKIKKPALILADIHMPEMSGYEFCKILKEDETLKPVPVIFISALHESSSKGEAFSCGGVDYITKPFQLTEVLARVDIHLRISEYQKKLEEKNIRLEQLLDELNKTQAQLIHTENMASLGVMASGIAHEINNPVNSINGNSQALKFVMDDFSALWKKLKEMDNVSPDLLKDFFLTSVEKGYDSIIDESGNIVDNIISASGRVANTIRDLLTFVHQESDEMLDIDIHECIDSALAVIPNEKMVEVVKEFNSEGIIKTSSGKLKHILLNLLTNAFDSFEELPERKDKIVKVKTELAERDRKSFTVISISDNGIGIEKENLKKIFIPFFTTKEVGKGTGLGLSICKGLIKSIGGEIKAESIITEGSKFEIVLPVK